MIHDENPSKVWIYVTFELCGIVYGMITGRNTVLVIYNKTVKKLKRVTVFQDGSVATVAGTVADYLLALLRFRPVLRCYHTGTITTEQFHHSFIKRELT